jgi:hypothetical protein
MADIAGSVNSICHGSLIGTDILLIPEKVCKAFGF